MQDIPYFFLIFLDKSIYIFRIFLSSKWSTYTWGNLNVFYYYSIWEHLSRARNRVTTHQIKNILIESKVTENLAECFSIYANIAQASRAKNFSQELQKLGIQINNQASGIKLLEDISQLAENKYKISIPSETTDIFPYKTQCYRRFFYLI